MPPRRWDYDISLANVGRARCCNEKSASGLRLFVVHAFDVHSVSTCEGDQRIGTDYGVMMRGIQSRTVVSGGEKS